jgi:hypothetical protein
MNNQDHISESLETIFWVKFKYLNSLIFGSGMEKNSIRDGKKSPPGLAGIDNLIITVI